MNSACFVKEKSMADDADSSSRKLGDIVSTRKRTRRRSHPRKAALSSSFINMAEARREIVNALQLHRSSSASVVRIHQNPSLLCTSRNHMNCYINQLTESMPIPQPTWSTTAPAVLSTSLCSAPPVEVLEVEWYDNHYSSSYAWWIGFLNSLDGKSSGGGKQVMESWEGECLEFDTRDDDHIVENSAPDEANDQSSLKITDEWLIFPAAGELERVGVEQPEST